MSQRIVINTCYGVFGLSRAAFLRLRELGEATALKEPDIGERFPLAQRGSVREDYQNLFCYDIPRDAPCLFK